ncbi:MAG: OmpH family outer membrane protein [candidate division Zixibacteria bacterium]|nr:OmpH family outer membrane protein [candidate division Zixibacteria bacterium]
MKRNKAWWVRVIILAGFVFALLVSSNSAQELKIGYVDVQRLKAEYKEYVQAQEKFNKLMVVWQAKADSLQKQIDSLQKKVQNPPVTMRQEAIDQLREKLLVKQNEYQLFANQVMGQDGEAAKKELELSKPLIDKINTVIKLVALKGNYTYVLDYTAGTVLYASEAYDLTDQVLAELNTSLVEKEKQETTQTTSKTLKKYVWELHPYELEAVQELLQNTYEEVLGAKSILFSTTITMNKIPKKSRIIGMGQVEDVGYIEIPDSVVTTTGVIFRGTTYPIDSCLSLISALEKKVREKVVEVDVPGEQKKERIRVLKLVTEIYFHGYSVGYMPYDKGHIMPIELSIEQ